MVWAVVTKGAHFGQRACFKPICAMETNLAGDFASDEEWCFSNGSVCQSERRVGANRPSFALFLVDCFKLLAGAL